MLPMFFVGLPDDRCESPHWGYMISGELTFRYADRDEVYERKLAGSVHDG